MFPSPMATVPPDHHHGSCTKHIPLLLQARPIPFPGMGGGWEADALVGRPGAIWAHTEQHKKVHCVRRRGEVTPSKGGEYVTKQRLGIQLPCGGTFHSQGTAYPHNGILFVQEKNAILIYTTTWMKLENNNLSERSQAKATNCMILFTLNVQKRQIHRDRLVLLGIWIGGDNGKWQLMHIGFSLGW